MLTIKSVIDTVAMVVPAYGRLALGRLDPDDAEQTIRDWAHRNIERARMKMECVIAEELDPRGPYVMMYNHQSYVDVPIIYATSPVEEIRMVAKSELFAVPIWGKALRGAGMVEVNRKDRAQAIDSLSKAGHRIREGTSVIIAPEGTRTPSGELMPLKKGGFHLAREAGVPIVPIAISGAYRVLAAHQKRMSYDVPVRVVYGAPIASVDRPIDETLAEVRAFYDEHVDLSMNHAT